MENYCYSWNGEDYSGLYDTEEEAIEDAKRDVYGREEVYIATAYRPSLSWNFSEEDILDSMEEQLQDECGEYAEHSLSHVTNAQMVELSNMIDEAIQKWVEKNKIEPTCYCVTNATLHRFHED